MSDKDKQNYEDKKQGNGWRDILQTIITIIITLALSNWILGRLGY